MSSKWYVELLLVLGVLGVAVLFALNVNFSSCNKTAKPVADKTEQNKSGGPMSPEKTKWLEGKDLFKSNCAACHNSKADGTGPALKGVSARWKAAGDYKGKSGEQWLSHWIQNWQAVVAEKYPYAIEMANSRPAQMNAFPYLKDEEVEKILFYVESPEAAPETTKK